MRVLPRLRPSVYPHRGPSCYTPQRWRRSFKPDGEFSPTPPEWADWPVTGCKVAGMRQRPAHSVVYRPTCTRHADGFQIGPCFTVEFQSSYATDMTSIPESSELMVEHASEAFMEDFRYAEAIARSAVALLARREMHAGPANVV